MITGFTVKKFNLCGAHLIMRLISPFPPRDLKADSTSMVSRVSNPRFSYLSCQRVAIQQSLCCCVYICLFLSIAKHAVEEVKRKEKRRKRRRRRRKVSGGISQHSPERSVCYAEKTGWTTLDSRWSGQVMSWSGQVRY